MRKWSSTSSTRQNPTRLPYSCQAQFGMSGIGMPPAGGVSTVRGIGCVGSHSSTLTINQTASRAPSGSMSLGRLLITEKSRRSDGSMTPSLNNYGSALADRYQSRISTPFQCSTPSWRLMYS